MFVCPFWKPSQVGVSFVAPQSAEWVVSGTQTRTSRATHSCHSEAPFNYAPLELAIKDTDEGESDGRRRRR